MIDALEVAVPVSVAPQQEFWSSHPCKPAKRGLAYQFTLDALRDVGVLVHYGRRYPTSAARRQFGVAFKDVRHLTAYDFVSCLTRIFDLKAKQCMALKLSRVDFAADIAGVPVSWFRAHCWIRHKQRRNKYRVIEEDLRGTETLYFGKPPDLFRFYNKAQEVEDRGRDLLFRGKGVGRPKPVVTRIERQCQGARIPAAVQTLGGLLKNAAQLRPFDALAFSDGGPVLDPAGLPAGKWLMSLGLREAVERDGLATVRARLNRHGNAARILKTYSGLLHVPDVKLTTAEVNRAYRNSTLWQLNQPDDTGRHPQGGLVMAL